MTNVQRIIKYCAIALAVSIIIGIATVLISGVGYLFGIFDNDSKKLKDGKEIEITNKITNIEIELTSTNLIIERDKKIYAATNNDKISYRIHNNTLIITENNNKLFNNTASDTELVIYIPDDHILNELSVESGAGRVEIFDVTIKDLELDLGAGTVDLDFIDVIHEAAIDGGAGKLSINNSTLNNLELDMGVGSLELESKLTGQNEITCGVGTATINLTGSENDYQVNIDKGLGATNVAGNAVKDGETIGTGKNIIEIEGGIGSITVDFIEDIPIYTQ